MMQKLRSTLIELSKARMITLSLVVIFVIITTGFSVLSPNFFKLNNFKSIITNLGTIGLVVIGETVVILAGGFDLSVGSIVGLASLLLVGMLDVPKPLPLPIVLFIITIFGMGLGSINGALVSILGINPIIATLATMAIFRGFSYMYVQQVAYLENPRFLQIGKGYFYGTIPYTIVYIVALMLITTFILKYTRLGRNMYLTGSNAYAAKLAGINAVAVRFTTYMISGITSTFAAIVLTSQVAMWRPGFGSGYEMEAITAVVLGGVSLRGGQGDLLSVFLAILILSTISNGLVLTDVNIYFRIIIKGVLLILVVAIDALRMAGLGSLRKRQSEPLSGKPEKE
jgi:ribose transport system permease protein